MKTTGVWNKSNWFRRCWPVVISVQTFCSVHSAVEHGATVFTFPPLLWLARASESSFPLLLLLLNILLQGWKKQKHSHLSWKWQALSFLASHKMEMTGGAWRNLPMGALLPVLRQLHKELKLGNEALSCCLLLRAPACVVMPGRMQETM